MQAQKVSRKAAAVGFEWETVQDVWDEVAEERAEFEAEAPGRPSAKWSLATCSLPWSTLRAKRESTRERSARQHGQVPPPLGRDGADGGQRPCGSG